MGEVGVTGWDNHVTCSLEFDWSTSRPNTCTYVRGQRMQLAQNLPSPDHTEIDSILVKVGVYGCDVSLVAFSAASCRCDGRREQ